MEVTPADEPVPAFKHRLTYDLLERLPGNRPQWYMRAYPENHTAWKTWREAASLDDDAGFNDHYVSNVPISEADWSQFKEARDAAQSILDDYIVPGAQRRECDWGLRFEMQTDPDMFSFLLPEFQAARNFARMANLGVRWSIAEHRYDDALKYVRATYQLGRDTAEEPLVVCGLIGIAITGIAHGGTIDLIAAPDSPNLYWALSELPTPPVSIKEAAELELSNGQRIYPFLDDPANTNHTKAEWNMLWSNAARFDDVDNLPFPQSRSSDETFDLVRELRPIATALSGYSHAKSRLNDWGFESDQIDQMAVGQVLAIYSARVYQQIADRYRQAINVPYGQQAKYFREADQALDDGANREIVPFASALLPAINSAIRYEMKANRELAALRVIEALRMHAARNDNEFPRTLDEVTCVPVPKNPATDKPFIYHLDGKMAVLELPEWEGLPGYSRRYEITIKQ